MTRTFVKGEPNDGLQEMYDAVLESQEAALSMIRAGVNGRDVHRKVAEVLHEAGYKTNVHDQEEGKPLTEGFFHGTGHGVGLELHEAPLSLWPTRSSSRRRHLGGARRLRSERGWRPHRRPGSRNRRRLPQPDDVPKEFRISP